MFARVNHFSTVLHVSAMTQDVVVLMAFSALEGELVPVMDVSVMWSRQQTCHTSMEMPVPASVHLPQTA